MAVQHSYDQTNLKPVGGDPLNLHYSLTQFTQRKELKNCKNRHVFLKNGWVFLGIYTETITLKLGNDRYSRTEESLAIEEFEMERLL